MKKFLLGLALLSMASLSLAGCAQQEETPVADDAMVEDVVAPEVSDTTVEETPVAPAEDDAAATEDAL